MATADHFSDFYEISQLPSIQSSAVVQATKQHFGHHGIPHTLFMDNGSQYTSDLFKEFSKTHKFNHITSLLVTIQIWKVSQTTSFVQLMMWTWHSCQCITLQLAGYTFSPAVRSLLRVLRSNLPQPITTLEPRHSPCDKVVSDHLHCKLQKKQNYDKHTRQLLPYYPLGSYVQASPYV